ncbi:MAG: Asp-tRNA(Asn)/Glu-tRNA(Gln) amidotransferase subunit GatC [Clostridia bacterium]|jgi:aspartyl-tRNA(Asn)/glutamyl-tRNA(Gln) amidotransferase subunit C
MKVDKETIQYIARLAMLKFTEEETAELAAEFDRILDSFEDIDKVDLTGLDMNPEADRRSVLRKDEARDFEAAQELFQNTREMRDGFIAIPKVLE